MADDPGAFVQGLQALEDIVGDLRGDHQHEADAAVKYLQHLRPRQVALRLQPLEDRLDRPGAEAEPGGHAPGQDAVDVVVETAARDMDHALDLEVAQQVERGPDVNAGGGEQGLGHGLAGMGHGIVRLKARGCQDLADQRIAVGMGAGRFDADNHVMGADARPVDDGGVVHQAHGKAGQIVHAVRIEAGHFGRLAAEQGAAGLLAAIGDAGHHPGGQIDRKFARCKIIKKK